MFRNFSEFITNYAHTHFSSYTRLTKIEAEHPDLTPSKKSELFVKEILNCCLEKPTDLSPTLRQNTNLATETRTLHDADDYIKLFYQDNLERAKQMDKAKGISTTLIQVQDKKIWARIGTQKDICEKDNSNELNHNYTRLFSAYCIAAVVMGEFYKFTGEKYLQRIHFIFITTKAAIEELINTYRQQKIAEKNLQKALIATLKKAKIDLISLVVGYAACITSEFSEDIQAYTCDPVQAVNIMLNQAKDWAAMEEPSYVLASIVELNDDQSKLSKKAGHMIILDEPLTELSTGQKEQLENHKQQQWYDKVTSFNKKLLDRYIPKILDEKHVVPSQLRDIAPVSKNLYKQSTFVTTRNNQPTDITEELPQPFVVKQLVSYIHTGTPANVSRLIDDPEAITQTTENLRQIKKNSGADILTTYILNSKHSDKALKFKATLTLTDPGPLDDSRICQLVEQATPAVKSEHILPEPICLNMLSVIERNANLQQNLIPKIINKIDDKDKETFQAELEKIKFRLKAFEASTTFNIANNRGTEKIALIILAFHETSQLISTLKNTYPGYYENHLQTIMASFGCASGNNRTGILEAVCILYSFHQFLYPDDNLANIDNWTEEQKARLAELGEIIVNTQHIQLAVGFQGGTLGLMQLRSKSIKAVGKKFEFFKKLFGPYADLKNIPYDSSERLRILSKKCAAKEKDITNLRAKIVGDLNVTISILPLKKRHAISAEYFKIGISTPSINSNSTEPHSKQNIQDLEEKLAELNKTWQELSEFIDEYQRIFNPSFYNQVMLKTWNTTYQAKGKSFLEYFSGFPAGQGPLRIFLYFALAGFIATPLINIAKLIEFAVSALAESFNYAANLLDRIDKENSFSLFKRFMLAVGYGVCILFYLPSKALHLYLRTIISPEESAKEAYKTHWSLGLLSGALSIINYVGLLVAIPYLAPAIIPTTFLTVVSVKFPLLTISLNYVLSQLGITSLAATGASILTTLFGILQLINGLRRIFFKDKKENALTLTSQQSGEKPGPESMSNISGFTGGATLSSTANMYTSRSLLVSSGETVFSNRELNPNQNIQEQENSSSSSTPPVSPRGAAHIVEFDIDKDLRGKEQEPQKLPSRRFSGSFFPDSNSSDSSIESKDNLQFSP